MYIALLSLLLGLAAVIIYSGGKNRNLKRMFFGVLIGVGSNLFFWFLDFWGELLWFESLGFENRFRTVVVTQAVIATLAAAFGCLFVYLLTHGNRKKNRFLSLLIGTLIGLRFSRPNYERQFKISLHLGSPASASSPELSCPSGCCESV
jgi:hypothetical protein